MGMERSEQNLTTWTVTRAVCFERLVEHGKLSGAPIHNGMPWSFEYMGLPVTHENDDCYLVGLGSEQVRFERSDTLLISEDGKPRVLKSGCSGSCNKCDGEGRVPVASERASAAWYAWVRVTPGAGMLPASAGFDAGYRAAMREPWKLIQSAPKDGRRVLLNGVCGDRGVVIVVGRFGLVTRAWHSVPGRESMVPTHWMPLPEPPDALGEV